MATEKERRILEGIMSDDAGTRNIALKKIYKEYFSRIETFVKSNNGDHSDAKDLFQEGVMILYESMVTGKFMASASVFTYLYSICRNLWLHKLRRKPMMVELIATEEISIEDFKAEQVNVTRLKKIMEQLKEDCKKILAGFYYESKSMEELSKMFNLGSVQAAKNKKSRCLKHLAKLIDKKGLTKENFLE